MRTRHSRVLLGHKCLIRTGAFVDAMEDLNVQRSVRLTSPMTALVALALVLQSLAVQPNASQNPSIVICLLLRRGLAVSTSSVLLSLCVPGHSARDCDHLTNSLRAGTR